MFNKTFFRNYGTPIVVTVLIAIAQLINWTVGFMPAHGRAAQNLIGIYLIPMWLGLLLIWFLFARHIRWKPTKIAVLAVIFVLMLVGYFSVSHIENDGDMLPIVHWRWQPTLKEKLAALPAPGEMRELLAEASPAFPGFFGKNRDGVVTGVTIPRDWKTQPPQQVWRRPIGGGYSGFALSRGVLVTLEQREGEEYITAYDAASGNERWKVRYPAKFNDKDKMGGEGPRATPTIDSDRVYALGATGELHCLDLATGSVIWRTNILQDADAQNAVFGMAGSPLVVSGKVIVQPGGTNRHSLIAYDKVDGKKIWHTGTEKASYAAPFYAKLNEVEQVVALDYGGISGYNLGDGKELWRQPFVTFNGLNIAQPIILPNQQVLLSAGYDHGSDLYKVSKEGDAFQVKEVWRSRAMMCKFASPVYRDGYIYGLDNGIMVCLDAATGTRKWKGGRYQHGQILLVDDVILVMTETGELAIVAADPKGFGELGKIKALAGPKTWNPPCVAGNHIYIRNHEEAACYVLPSGKGS